MPQLVEILHELCHSNAFFLDNPSQPGKQVVEVIRGVAPNSGISLSRLVGIVLEVVSVRPRQLLPDFVVQVNIANELIVIDVCQVTPVHVFFQQQVQQFFIRREELELFENANELILRDVANLSDIEVLELRLQMQSLCSYHLSVALNQLVERRLFLRSEVQG